MNHVKSLRVMSEHTGGEEVDPPLTNKRRKDGQSKQYRSSHAQDEMEYCRCV